MYEKIIAEFIGSDVPLTYKYTATTTMTVIVLAASGCGGGCGLPLNKSNHYGYAEIKTDGVVLESLIKNTIDDGYVIRFSTYCDIIQLCEGQQVTITNNSYNYGNNIRMIIRIA